MVRYLFLLIFPSMLWAQPVWRDSLDLDNLAPNTVHKFWLNLGHNALSQRTGIPVIVIKGNATFPVLGLTAAIHGNELNGIPVIQKLTQQLDPNKLEGTIVAVPGLNTSGIVANRREFSDGADLNRIFPGKPKGNESEQYTWNISTRLLPHFDFLVDMHTASFGRENTHYVRADMANDTLATFARLQGAEILLSSSGKPSTGGVSSASRTLREEAVGRGIPTITVEYGNPQVYQKEIVNKGLLGIKNILSWLKMIPDPIEKVPKAVVCKKSYWIYTGAGGYLEILVGLNQKVDQGETLAILRNPFGDIVQTYVAPETGIVIGRSSNPVSPKGARIVHLGILQD